MHVEDRELNGGRAGKMIVLEEITTELPAQD
jgi:hypothetical protein